MNESVRDENAANPAGNARKIGKRDVGWSLAFVVIAALSIWAIASQSRNFSIARFMDYVSDASLSWLLLGMLAMLAYICLEGAAILEICRAFGYRRRRIDGFTYASADIYFSAITPSATGGQPASAYFMMYDGVPGSVATVALLVNLIMYTLSIVVIGIACFVLRPNVFAGFSPLARWMIGIGCAVQCGLAAAFILLLKSHALLHRACGAVLRLLARMRIVRRLERKQAKLNKAIADYRANVRQVAGQWSMLGKVFALNLLQRLALIFVTVCAYRAVGGAAARMADAWAVQGFSILGYSFVPVPGAMGVADMLLLDGFGQLVSSESAVNLELLSRAMSFYSCIVICGIAVLVKYMAHRTRKRG